MSAFETIAEVLKWVSILGVGGILVIWLGGPALVSVVFVQLERIVERLLARVIATRLGCVGLALAIAVPIAHAVGGHDEAAREALREAQTRAALLEKWITATRVAARNDNARAAAAEDRAQKAENRANELASKVPDTPGFSAADTDQVRQLWRARSNRRPAAAARSIEDLLRKGSAGAGARAAHQAPTVSADRRP